MKAIVTGAAGFIGSHLVDRLLLEGHEVIGIDNFVTGRHEFLENAKSYESFKLFEMDLLDLENIKRIFSCDIVFHLAANADVRYGIENPYRDLEQNTIATYNVLEAMRHNKVKKIAFSSTGSIYGESEVIPTPENANFPIQTSLYGASKLACEGLISAYAEGFEFQSWIFRFVSVLGERYTHGHVYDFYKQLKNNPHELKVLGNGKQNKSYMYVGDCIDAILLSIKKSKSKVNILNLGLDQSVEIDESILYICKKLNVKPELTYTGGDKGWIGDNPHIHLDINKILNLGWKPKVSIKQGIEKTIDFLLDNEWVLETRREQLDLINKNVPQNRKKILQDETKYLVVGGGGFIGSYVVDMLLSKESTSKVIVYDNFCSGKKWHLKEHLENNKFQLIEKDIYDKDIFECAKNIDVTIMLAANADIASALTDPQIDFTQGTHLLQIVLEAMRQGGCKKLLYASGSGVYGETGYEIVSEDYSPMQPISTYGASKLSCEALICSYCYMFNIEASAFRFGNVVGGRQTHGVAYDFMNRLKNDCSILEILGDGMQSKPYIYIDDVVSSIFIASEKQTKIFDVYNVAPQETATVNEIADIVLEQMNIKKSDCQYKYTGGDRGWKGDVPIVRLNTKKIEDLGWKPSMNSIEAIKKSVSEMYENIENFEND